MPDIARCASCGRLFERRAARADHKLLQADAAPVLCKQCRPQTAGGGKLIWLLAIVVVLMGIGFVLQSQWFRDWQARPPSLREQVERVIVGAAPTFAPGPRSAPVPSNNPGRWVTPRDYPSRALRKGIVGTSGFRLTVDATGRVSECIITSSSGSSDLDEATCRAITRRARFAPQTDAAGDPVAGQWESRVRWEIPD